MKILFSFPHPAYRLDEPGVGYVVRANAMIDSLQKLGAEVIVEQAAVGGAATAHAYRRIVKKLLPRQIAMRLRDRGRVIFGKKHGHHLSGIARNNKVDVIVQTFVAFNLSGQIASKVNRVPLVLEDMTTFREEFEQYGVGNRHLAKSTYDAITEQASLCVVPGMPLRRYLVEDGVAPDKIVIIPNAIDPSIFHKDVDGQEIRKRYRIEENTLVVVFVGSFQPYHRADLLVDAIGRLRSDRKICLLLVGAGREQSQAQTQAQIVGSSIQVEFTGAVRYSDVPPYIAASDIAVLPATNSFGNPMKLYEYMALGKSVVAPGKESVTEIGSDGKELMTFPPDDVDALAQVLDTLISDEALRCNLGASAAKLVEMNHTWLNRAESLLTSIEEILP